MFDKGWLRERVDEVNNNQKKCAEDMNRVKYGKLNGYHKWDLAKAWLTMSNDGFYRLYGFNWVPPVWMYEEARKYL